MTYHQSFVSECPLNYVFYNGHCYRFFDETFSWSASRDQCREEGEQYDLVVINDSGENQFLKDNIKNSHSESQYWIGLKENCDRGGFIWVDESDLSYNNWKNGQPNHVSIMKSQDDRL